MSTNRNPSGVTGTAGALRAAARRREARQQCAEWESRIRSPDPAARGAGMWPTLPGPPDAPLDEFDRWDLLVYDDTAFSPCFCWERGRPLVRRVIPDPGA